MKKKPMKKKATKKKATKKAKKPAKKKVKAKGRKISAEKKAAVQTIAKAVTAKMLGKVVHYYDRIGVAIIDLESPMRIGDKIVLKRGDMELVQEVASMQIDHNNVATAKKGDTIGIKVKMPVSEGTVVMPV